MIYPATIPPFEFESFRALTKSQAQDYFNWYISTLPERVRLLGELVNSMWRCGITLDYSLESLDPLWKTFETRIKVVKEGRREIMAANAGAPEHLMEEILKDRRRLSRDTLIIAMDIAMYYGETLAKNWPCINWGFFTKPKNAASVNEPVLLGFQHKMYMEPAHMIIVACYKSIEKGNPRYLSELTNIWSEYLPDDCFDVVQN